MNPYDKFRIITRNNIKKETFLNDNKKCLYDHGVLHIMISIKVKYIPGNVYNQIKEMLTKHWKAKSLLGLYSSKNITSFTNHQITERNMRCKICIT